MRKTIAIAVGLLSFGSVAAFAHTIDRASPDATWNLTVHGDEAIVGAHAVEPGRDGSQRRPRRPRAARAE